MNSHTKLVKKLFSTNSSVSLTFQAKGKVIFGNFFSSQITVGVANGKIRDSPRRCDPS